MDLNFPFVSQNMTVWVLFPHVSSHCIFRLWLRTLFLQVGTKMLEELLLPSGSKPVGLDVASCMQSDIGLTWERMKSIIFWDIMPCSSMSVNRRFRGTYRLHLQGRKISWARNQHERRWQVPTPNGLQDVIYQKMVRSITTAVRTSNPTWECMFVVGHQNRTRGTLSRQMGIVNWKICENNFFHDFWRPKRPANSHVLLCWFMSPFPCNQATVVTVTHKMDAANAQKQWYRPTRQHCVTTQKITIWISVIV
jgi:hypothetical protein